MTSVSLYLLYMPYNKAAVHPAAEPRPGSSRPYHSDRRAQAASDTRAKILDSAMRLFLQSGYGKVTVGDIAHEANVAVPTVYASTGGKSAILATLIDEAMRDPVVDATLAAVRRCHTADDAIRTLAHGVRVDNERYHNMIEVMKTAAAIDDSATSILERSDRIYQRALGQVVPRLRELDGLQPGLSTQQAVDILWFYLGHHAWHLLATQRHWSWDTAEQWLADQATTALCRRV